MDAELAAHFSWPKRMLAHLASTASTFFSAIRLEPIFFAGITSVLGVAFVPHISLANGLLIASAGCLSVSFASYPQPCEWRRQVLQGAGLALAAAVFFAFSPPALILQLASVAALQSRSLRKYRRIHRMSGALSLVAIAIASNMAARGAMTTTVLTFDTSRSALIVALAAIFFAYEELSLTAAFATVRRDHAAHVGTAVTRYGRRGAALIGDLNAAITLGLVLLCWYLLDGIRALPVPAMIFLVAGVVESFRSQFNLHHVHSAATAYHAIVPSRHAYMLLLSSLVLVLHPTWGPGTVAFYAAYVLAQRLMPRASSIAARAA